MQVTYTSSKYKPELVLKRYVKYCPYDGAFRFCEVGKDGRYDLRQGIVYANELAEDIRVAAIEQAKVSIHYIDWPEAR